MFTTRRIGLYGGAFNPPHLGHLMVANSAKNALSLDLLYFIPTNISPHKSNSENIDSNHRFNMLKLMTQSDKNYEVLDFEIKSENISYTYLTVNHIKKIHPNSKLFLLTGEDMFLTLENWKNAKEFLQKVTPVVLKRSDDKNTYERLVNYASNRDFTSVSSVILLTDYIDISSSEIREKLKNNAQIDRFLHKDVVKYIKDFNLYK